MNSILHLPILILLISLGWIAYEVEQASFGYLISLYSLAFGAYILILKNRKEYFIPFLLGIVIIARLMLIPTFPLLSDDIYRFYWDAWVYDQGISPYARLPTEVMTQMGNIEMREIYSKLNSPNYYSVYPPFLQWVFRIAYWTAPTIKGFSLAYKMMILIAELISIACIYFSLKKLEVDRSSVIIYALNPLILLELVGNGHPEAFMITGLCLLIYGLIHLPSLLSLGWAIGIGVKLQPLLLAPLLLSYSFLKKRSIWTLGGIGLGLLTLSPLLLHMEYLLNFGKSLRLYSQTFEFNGSLYKLVRWMGYQLEGYNMIQTTGPLLAGIAFVTILLLAGFHLIQRRTGIYTLLRLMILSWLIYLLCSPIVHPWYIAPLIFFASFISFRSIIAWSYLIMISYIAYYTKPVYEPTWLAFIQYVPVVTLLYFDLFRNQGKYHNERSN